MGFCYLCEHKVSTRDGISLHKFPKDSVLRNKWIEACNLSMSDNVTYVYICSLHFAPEDIDRGLEFGRRRVLRFGAVPSIGVPNPIRSNNEKTNIVNNRNGNIVEPSKIQEIEMINVIDGSQLNTVAMDINTSDDVYDDSLTFNNRNATSELENTHVRVLQLPTNASPADPFELCNDFINQRQLVIIDATVDNAVNSNFGNSEESCYSTTRRRVFEPRYPSEIRPSDFETPEKTRRTVKMVQDSDIKKSKLIKSLKDQNRNLNRRVSALKKIIVDLKKKDMLAQKSGKTSMAVMRASDGTPTKIKVNGQYTPDIKSFAITLYGYSTKAYDYVRQQFDYELPNPSTIRAWNVNK